MSHLTLPSFTEAVSSSSWDVWCHIWTHSPLPQTAADASEHNSRLLQLLQPNLAANVICSHLNNTQKYFYFQHSQWSKLLMTIKETLTMEQHWPVWKAVHWSVVPESWDPQKVPRPGLRHQDPTDPFPKHHSGWEAIFRRGGTVPITPRQLLSDSQPLAEQAEGTASHQLSLVCSRGNRAFRCLVIRSKETHWRIWVHYVLLGSLLWKFTHKEKDICNSKLCADTQCCKCHISQKRTHGMVDRLQTKITSELTPVNHQACPSWRQTNQVSLLHCQKSPAAQGNTVVQWFKHSLC